MMANNMPNYLCISIDGLHSGMIGAFGNAWIHTPTLDSLACQSVLFDRFYASSLDLSEILSGWRQLPPNHHKILLTDDTDVFLHEQAKRFDEKHRLESKRRSRPAGKLEETQWFRNMATIADLLRNRSDKPFLLWAHFEGFRGCWDFPLSYRQRYQIDEDPDPYPGVSPPDFRGANIDPDVLQSVMEAYSGGVSLLDDALAGLLAFLQKEGFDQNTVLLFTSVRGFSLGEHDYIGSCGELYSENVHLPLIIRFPEYLFSGFRSQTLLQPADVWKILRKGEIPEEPATVHPSLRIGKEVIVTPDWYVYQKPSGKELYVKPDDRWEVNDVADRCPHILEQIVSGTE
ncbi:MAG: sulfatase-like hydrolase/transferase [Planctomycetaceae bacterium]|jgi:arylsulfatase A-like enzyme|nr:sulfatase-like hydrolase/transferase [Planctomycetaceae bacterium]